MLCEICFSYSLTTLPVLLVLFAVNTIESLCLVFFKFRVPSFNAPSARGEGAGGWQGSSPSMILFTAWWESHQKSSACVEITQTTTENGEGDPSFRSYLPISSLLPVSPLSLARRVSCARCLQRFKGWLKSPLIDCMKGRRFIGAFTLLSQARN